MLLQEAIDEFLLYLEIEKNYSKNTVAGYSFDFKTFEDFLVKHHRSLELNDIHKTLVRRFIQEQITKENMKPPKNLLFKIVYEALYTRKPVDE